MNRIHLLRAALLCLAVAVCTVAFAQVPSSTITFQFENSALNPARFTIEVAEDGHGHYHSEEAVASAPSPSYDRDIVLSEPLRKQLFATAHHDHLFAAPCEMKHGNLAFTGTKTLRYQGPDGASACTFNYPRDPQVQAVATSLIGVSATLEQGRRLESLLVHDRLGLDAAVSTLADLQASGMAAELQNVAPVLHAIAEDQNVLNHTRSRAAALLVALAVKH